ncbi:PIG-L deacetylase family protein [Nocardioides sp.]|uniref:PIG-L deacetylase family protein n=1 Tax=Nocardioides sp. TaxID=35761 RepID=UPI0035296D98
MTPAAGHRRFTLVSFHAHPDDEALLTGGTLARAAAEGHRVVLVVATAGEAGLAADEGSLGERRRAELSEAAAALGVARVEVLGYPDSGFDARVGGACFARTDPAEVAGRLADLLVEEAADVLTSYDVHGGYGHADHVQVHRVAALAAAGAGTPVLLEATLDRRLFGPLVSALRVAGRVLPMPQLPEGSRLYSPHAALTHRVDVRPHLAAKRAALTAHASQAGGPGTGSRTLSLLLGLPRPVFTLVAGREWFREVGRTPSGPLLDDVFASLR